MARTTVPSEVLNKLLKERAALTPECEHCALGQVVSIAVDATGCNWKVSRIQGAHCADCLIALTAYLKDLRQRFTLQSADEMDPTLLTTWAMR